MSVTCFLVRKGGGAGVIGQKKDRPGRGRAKKHVNSKKFQHVNYITPLSAQISAKKFQNLSQIPLKICVVWKKKTWCLTQTLT